MTDDWTRVEPTPELVDQVVAGFGLGPISGWRDLGGSWTTNLLLGCSRGDVVARVHQRRTTSERVRAEQAARAALADAGIPTVVPLTDRGDGTVQLVNDRPVEIEPFRAWTDRMNTPDLVRRGFTLLGSVHDVLREADLPDAARSVVRANHIGADEAAAVTRAGAARLRRSGDPELARFADDAERHADAVWRAEAPLLADQVVQVVHGDFWDNNVLFAEGEVAALLDFGFMAQRPRVDDLALTIWFLLLEPGAGLPTDDSIALVAQLLDAYDAGTHRPLSAAERASLPLAVARQPAWSVGGWVLALDETNAYRHARAAVPEQPVAAAVLRDLARWQDALAT